MKDWSKSALRSLPAQLFSCNSRPSLLRNGTLSKPSYIDLFKKVDCKNIVSCASQDQMLQHMFDAVPHIRKVHAPTPSSILAEDSVPHCPYDVTFETAANYDIVTIHTSGISGNPKLIGWNTRYLSKIDQGNDLPILQGAPLVKSTLWHENSLCLLPCFHVRSLQLFLPGDYRVLKAI
jgi:hypothetical protein